MGLMAGVSGIRGIVGQTLTPQLAVSAGCAWGSLLEGGTVVVGRDSRPSGEMVRHAVISGLLSCGCDVVDVGITTTPGTALAVTELNAVGGIMLTASHNPSEWNGIKFLTAEGSAPTAALATRVLEKLRSEKFQFVPYQKIGRVQCDNSISDKHVRKVLSMVDAERIRTKRFRVVLDSVNGGGGASGRMLLEALGCNVVHINAEPHGLFAHTPEPIKENLTGLCEELRRCGAAIGFAQDPDADRLAIVDERGEYIGEEYTLALAARHVFSTRPGAACANLSTSRMIDDLAAAAGGDCRVHRSAVGEANVVETMRANHCVIGGEGNGGVIQPGGGFVRDSLASMALVLELLATEDKPLSAVVAEIPHYAMVKQKFPCERSRIDQVLAAVREAFAAEKINDIDGVRIDWPQGWVHIRGSNTEPIMRIIAEAADETTAVELIQKMRDVESRID